MAEKASKALRKVDRVLSAIRAASSSSVPVQLVHTFILVAENEGAGVVELSEKAGATKGTMSRHLLDLSDRLRSGEPGYGLLQRTPDPTNLRSVSYTLTSKGKLLKRQIEDIVED